MGSYKFIEKSYFAAV